MKHIPLKNVPGHVTCEKEPEPELLEAINKMAERAYEQEKHSVITEWLLKNGFQKCYGEDGYDCVLRLHVLHYLFWSENLKHFSIGVLNERGAKTAGGGYKKWNMVMIPKPIYTIDEAERLIKAITI